MSPEPVIKIEGLLAGYDGARVLRDISLHVDAGEVVGLLGPNGAGKTTTLRAIAAEIRPMDGEVTVLGNSTRSISAHRLASNGLTHVAEHGNHFPSLTVNENLSLALPRGKAAQRDGLELAVRLFPAMGKLMTRPAGLLSGGEQQMLAMAQAIAPHPKVMLIDELSLGLAPVIVEQLLPTVRAAAAETGCAVVLVEQHVHMALEVVDRAYVLNQGRITMEGNAMELAQKRDLLESSYMGNEEAAASSEGVA